MRKGGLAIPPAFQYLILLAESCFSIALLFLTLEKGPFFIFWTAHPGAALSWDAHFSAVL